MGSRKFLIFIFHLKNFQCDLSEFLIQFLFTQYFLFLNVYAISSPYRIRKRHGLYDLSAI